MKISIRLVILFAIAVPAIAAPAAALAATINVSLSLTKFTKVTHLAPGASVGVDPSRVVVHVGDAIVFVNEDATSHHTATGLGAGTRGAKFAESPKWTDAVLKPFGAIGAETWSSGDLAPGARSQPLRADRPGDFLYGCFFDYGAGMRGEIVVEP